MFSAANSSPIPATPALINIPVARICATPVHKLLAGKTTYIGHLSLNLDEEHRRNLHPAPNHIEME